MANNVRFVDNVAVSAYGNTGTGGTSVSSSYAETASFAHYATSASYAISASHEIIKEVSSSYADTASFAQSGDGVFSGSFSGSFDGDGSNLTGVDPFPFSGSAIITGSLVVSGSSDGIYSPNQIKAEGIFKVGDTAFFRSSPAVLHLGLGSSECAAVTTERDCIQFRTSTNTTSFGGVVPFEIHDNYIELNTPVTASSNISSSGYVSASYFVGDGSQLTNLPLVTSSSYAISASYAVSASHEIIKEVSSSYADTASFAQSGDGIFSGSFSGSYIGDGSGLTGVDPFPFSGSAVITGSLVVSGSSKPIEVIGSGSTVFSVVGSLGELFAIDDVLSGSLLVINDVSGIPQFEVFSDGRTLIGADPRSLYTTATISATVAATSESIYSLSTSSYDGVFFDYTISSASNARAGNIMSIWNGGSLVYTENTTTDIGSTTGVNFDVIISQSQAQLISVTDTAGWKIKTTIRSI